MGVCCGVVGWGCSPRLGHSRIRIPVCVDVVTLCNYYCLMEFEWDEVKRKENLRKHGLDFLDAPALNVEPLCGDSFAGSPPPDYDIRGQDSRGARSLGNRSRHYSTYSIHGVVSLGYDESITPPQAAEYDLAGSNSFDHMAG